MKKLIIYLCIFTVGFITGKADFKGILNRFLITKVDNISVIDGDTVHIKFKNNIEKVRLLYIDCHETSNNNRTKFQSKLYNIPYEEIYKLGEQEAAYLENLLNKYKGQIYLKRKGRDAYGRTLGILMINKNISINNMILENSICPPYVAR